MDIAVKISIDNVLHSRGGPFGAVILKDGKIIGQGGNRVVLQKDPTAHAEIIALRQACQHLNTFSLEGCTLFSSTEPCPMCYAAIRWARIDNIFYANTRQDAERAGFSDKAIYDEIEKKQLKTCHQAHPKALQAFDFWHKMEGIPY